MSKLASMSMLLLGVTVLLQLAGIPTGLSPLFSYAGFEMNDSGLTGFSGGLSDYAIAIIAVFGAAGAAGIVIGYFTKSSLEWALLSLYATGIALMFISTFVSIINYAAGMDDWIRNAVILIYGLFGAGFIWGVMDWVFGRE
jgi:hypothetical protein